MRMHFDTISKVGFGLHSDLKRGVTGWEKGPNERLGVMETVSRICGTPFPAITFTAVRTTTENLTYATVAATVGKDSEPTNSEAFESRKIESFSPALIIAEKPAVPKGTDTLTRLPTEGLTKQEVARLDTLKKAGKMTADSGGVGFVSILQHWNPIIPKADLIRIAQVGNPPEALQAQTFAAKNLLAARTVLTSNVTLGYMDPDGSSDEEGGYDPYID
jgi:hypothetical protein